MDTVLGDICHWKYIKKKKVNGKWKYYYDADQLKDDLGFDERNAVNKQRRFMESSKAMTTIKRDEAKQQYDRLNEPYISKESYNIRKDRYNKAVEDVFDADRAYSIQKQKCESLVAKYEKTPIGKLETNFKKVERFLFGR